jgi:hypothetical protein
LRLRATFNRRFRGFRLDEASRPTRSSIPAGGLLVNGVSPRFERNPLLGISLGAHGNVAQYKHRTHQFDEALQVLSPTTQVMLAHLQRAAQETKQVTGFLQSIGNRADTAQEDHSVNDDRDRTLSFQRATKHELARFLAVAVSVVSIFGLILWGAQQ